MELQRNLGGHVRDAGRERPDAERVIRRHQVIPGATDPVQAVPDLATNDLKPSHVALAILPRNQGGDGRQPFDQRGTGMEPVAAVNQQSQRCRRTESAVVGDDTILFRGRIVRRECEDPRRAAVRRLACEQNSERRVEAGPGDYRDFPVRFFDDGADDLEVFRR